MFKRVCSSNNEQTLFFIFLTPLTYDLPIYLRSLPLYTKNSNYALLLSTQSRQDKVK